MGAVVAVLDMLPNERGLLESLLVDNGPEFVCKVLDRWVTSAFLTAPGRDTTRARRAQVESTH